MKQFIVFYIFWSSSYHISILCSFKVLLHLYIDNNSKQYIYHENIILKKNIRQLRSPIRRRSEGPEPGIGTEDTNWGPEL